MSPALRKFRDTVVHVLKYSDEFQIRNGIIFIFSVSHGKPHYQRCDIQLRGSLMARHA